MRWRIIVVLWSFIILEDREKSFIIRMCTSLHVLLQLVRFLTQHNKVVQTMLMLTVSQESDCTFSTHLQGRREWREWKTRIPGFMNFCQMIISNRSIYLFLREIKWFEFYHYSECILFQVRQFDLQLLCWWTLEKWIMKIWQSKGELFWFVAMIVVRLLPSHCQTNEFFFWGNNSWLHCRFVSSVDNTVILSLSLFIQFNVWKENFSSLINSICLKNFARFIFCCYHWSFRLNIFLF